MYPNSEDLESIVLAAKPIIARLKGSIQFLENCEIETPDRNTIENVKETGREIESLSLQLDGIMDRVFKVANDADLYFEEQQTNIEESNLAEAITERREGMQS